MTITKEQMIPIWEGIEDNFVARFSTVDAPKKGGQAYQKQKAEFFSGAMSALLATLPVMFPEATEEEINGNSMPAFWVLALLSGRELKCEARI